MRVLGIQQKISFGRALTSKEKNEYQKIQNEARRELGLGTTMATVFDFSVPKQEHDNGIGTSFSTDAQKMAEFLKTMCGVNSIQLQPQGQISNYIRSPYSGTSFSLGMHLIDLSKLTEDEYGNILTLADIQDPYMRNVNDCENVNYDNVFSENGHEKMLKTAYQNFIKTDKNHHLKKEYEKFKKENSYWLERDALFEACAVANKSQDMNDWPLRDKNIFATKEIDTERIKELKKVKDKEGNNIVDYNEFVQFIADKQQKESKEMYNKQGIEIYGDCQIGFSQKDYWAHKSAFYENYEFGCDLGDGEYTCWSPAIDYGKLNGEAGELLYNKFNMFFKRYNGVRIDAAWQFIKPLICEPLKENGKDVFDKHGNKLGKKLSTQPQVENHGQFIMKDIILKAAHKNGIPANKILLELLGGNAYDSLDAVKHLGMQLIHITRYGANDWGRVKYYEMHGSNKYQNMKPGEYIIGPGTHDDFSLIEQADIMKNTPNGKERANYLAKDLHLNQHELEQSTKAMTGAIFAELFTTKNQFATLPDILGSERRINTPNTTEGNWLYRAGRDYEKEYYRNLAQGKGLNAADAYSKALKVKTHGKGSALTQKLDKYASILREQGPMTTEEANIIMA